MTNRAGRRWGSTDKGIRRPRQKALPNTVRNLLESKIHRAYTVACDELFMRGHMSRDERLAIGGMIGDLLTKLGESLDPALAMRTVDPEDVAWLAAEKSAPLTVFKQADGSYRWVLISSNAFEDRDREIVSHKALATDVARADADGDYGPLLYWHMDGRPDQSGVPTPRIELGGCDFNAMHGRMLVESGTFHHAPVAQAVKEGAAELGVSIGFNHPESEPDADGVFHSIRRFERSLLPRQFASNPLTAVPIVEKENKMDADKLKAFAMLLKGDDKLVSAVLGYGATAEKGADARGVRHKQAGDAPPVAELSACVKAKMEAGSTEAEARKLCAEESAPVAEEKTDKSAGEVFMGDMTPAQFNAHLMTAFKSFGEELRAEVKAQLAEQSTTKAAADQATAETLKEYSAKLDLVAGSAAAALEGVAELKGELPRALGERLKGWQASKDGEQPTAEQKKEAMPSADPNDPWAAHFKGLVGVNAQQG